MNERIKELRKYLNLSQDAFGKKIGMSGGGISLLEKGKRNITAANIKAICREFSVDYIWLTTGEGKMFIELPPQAEIDILVSQLLTNADPHFRDLILDTMRTYAQLTPSNREIFTNVCRELLHNLKNKKED